MVWRTLAPKVLKNTTWIGSKLKCKEKHHPTAHVTFTNRQCIQGTVVQQNPVIFRKQEFKQSHFKYYFETAKKWTSANLFQV